MKVVYIFAMFAVCYGFVVKRDVVNVPSPNEVSSTLLSNASCELSWVGVKSEDNDDPIIGYKLRVWELTPVKTTVYSLVNGEFQETEKESEEPVDVTKTPQGKLTEILTSPTVTTAVTEPLKPGVTYEFRILAYTKRGEGQSSSPIIIKINNE